MSVRADRSLYIYPWDALEPDRIEPQLSDLGISSLTLAMSYHAGKFLRPTATAPRVIFPEDGVVYFQTDSSKYGEIKPQQASDQRLLAIADHYARQRPIRAWTVVFHNTRLGQTYPNYVTRNAWGDPYWYSLCPNHPAVFEYAINLCKDLDQQTSVSELVLESPTWLPFAHGYHHEFAQVHRNIWLDTLLGLCFCDACQQQAQTQGLQGQSLATWVRQRVDSYLASGVDANSEQAHHWLQLDLLQNPDLAAWIRWRQSRVTELISSIKQAISKPVWVIPTIQRPTAASWSEGTQLQALALAADGLEVPFYEPTVKAFAADAWHTLQQVGDAQRIRAILRPAPPDLADGAELKAALAVLQQFGIQHSAYYNFGLMRPERLKHLAQTLQALA